MRREIAVPGRETHGIEYAYSIPHPYATLVP